MIFYVYWSVQVYLQITSEGKTGSGKYFLNEVNQIKLCNIKCLIDKQTDRQTDKQTNGQLYIKSSCATEILIIFSSRK